MYKIVTFIIHPALPEIDKSYDAVRANIQEMNRKVRQEAEGLDDGKYYIDAHLGLSLYEYLWSIPGFSLRVAANDGFWRYLSVKVAPDVVAQRWGKDNDDHYWSKPTRIWFRSLETKYRLVKLNEEQDYRTDPQNEFQFNMRNWYGAESFGVTANAFRNNKRDFPIFARMKQGDDYTDASRIADELFDSIAASNSPYSV